MANHPSDGPNDDFLEQILGFPTYAAAETTLAGTAADPMLLQLSSGDGSAHIGGLDVIGGRGGYHGSVFPLGLSLDQGKAGFMKVDDASASGNRFREDVVDVRAHSVKSVSVVSGDCFSFGLCLVAKKN